MHHHQCRYCLNPFVCDEPRDECFERYLTCKTCWFDHDLKHIAIFIAALIVAVAATLFLIWVYTEKEKPALSAPVSMVNEKKSTTGEKYYSYGITANRRRADHSSSH